MAKRYHQSKRARMNEERGEERHLRGPVRHHSSAKIHHMPDKFNDEYHRDSDGEAYGRYHYDREESRASERSMHRRGNMLGAEHYAGMEPRRRQELEDAGMIHEDHRAIANLPQEVMIKPYPYGYSYTPEEIDDTIRGVDRQLSYDDGKRDEHMYPKKV